MSVPFVVRLMLHVAPTRASSSAVRGPVVWASLGWPKPVVCAAVACVAALSWTPLSGVSAQAAPHTSVVDDLGRDVVVPTAPKRIVSMMPSHAETVCALGACHLLVGVDDFTILPPEAGDVPTLGSAYDGNVEAIVALAPDLVLVDEYSGLAEALAALDIPVYAGTPQRLEEIADVILEIGTLLRASETAAGVVAQIEAGLDAITMPAPGADAPVVFLELDATPYSAGPASFLGQLLTLAGARNVVPADTVDFPLVEVESILAADPDVILLLDAPYGVTAAAVADRPGWSGIQAVRTGAVVEVDAADVDLLSRAGPRVVEALARLVDLVHGPQD